MYTIVGLGNPGDEYKNNRHNVGRLFLDFVLNTYQGNKFQHDKKLHSFITKIQADKNLMLLVKPNTYMNNSGIAVHSCVTRYKLHVAHDLFVAHDDLDIPLGKFKIQKGTGPKLHNGLESIENHLKNLDFYRIRIGVENRDPERRIPGEAYVLQNFTEEEDNILTSTFPKIVSRLQQDVFLKGLST